VVFIRITPTTTTTFGAKESETDIPIFYSKFTSISIIRYSTNSGNNILHSTLFAPHLRRFALALNVVGVHAAGVLDFDDSLYAVFVFHEKIRHVSPLVFLPVNPGNGDAVSFHPFGNVRITL